MTDLKSTGSKKKYVFIIDFDNTLIAKNTDREIINAQTVIGKCISAKNWFLNDVGWSESMSYTLKDLYLNGVTKEDVDKIILGIPLIDGIASVFDQLQQYKGKHEIVMLSHSNVYFIDILLKKFGRTDLFDTIYTYNTEWLENEQLLSVKPYDIPNTNCDLCPIDFCKGVCVETHKDKLNLLSNGKYDSIIYIGDGSADFCAACALSENDHVLARKDFPLHKRINKDQNNKMKAKSTTWVDGHDILAYLKTLL